MYWRKNSRERVNNKFLNSALLFFYCLALFEFSKKEKILEIVSEGKGVIPYEMIIDMQSFFITLEKDFWEKT